MAGSVAATGLFGACYDNINMVFKVVEQVIGRTGRQLFQLVVITNINTLI